ncbi:MAG: acetylserotonin O-methyltransferase [Desulfobacterales bacterium]|jgi:predicted O-methyltransferase YrrM|nr:acetylserotonin O-methyltransferase [Desulfobacterales bacterium]
MDSKGWNVGKLLQVSGSYWSSCALHAAVKLDLFSALQGDRLTAAEIAARLQGSGRGVEALLNAMAAFGLLEKAVGRYANSPAARALLCRESPEYIGHMIMHHHHLVESWSRLDQAVVAGRPVRENTAAQGPQWRESFLMGMFTNAMATAPHIVSAIDLSSRRRLLDFGGGPGTYAVQFCLKNPGLTADVFDLPESRPFAEKTIARFGLGKRVCFLPGDYHRDEIAGPYDVAWLSHILHAEGPEGCLNILRKAVSALSPGGMVIIHEFILNETMDGPLFPALFSLNMLVGTPSGQAYSETQLMEMLAAAGARQIRRIPVATPTESGIILGTL